MAQRKAWNDLAASTRARYARAAVKLGLEKSDANLIYNTRALPSSSIYGKKPTRRAMSEGWTPTQRQIASIERLARKAGIKSTEVDDILGRAIDAGASYSQVEKILQQRIAIRKLPKAERKAIGRAWYDERSVHLPIELFWY